MDKCQALLNQALAAPSGLRFGELCYLAECYGFTRARQKGSHVIYKRTGYVRAMNFQDVRGMAKTYQVKQLLDALRELELIE